MKAFIRASIGVLGVCLVLMVGLLLYTRQQTPRPAARVFLTDVGEGLHIYRQWRDEGAIFRLTDRGNKTYRSLAWSPDGRWIGYTDDTIYLLPSNGHTSQKIIDGYNAWLSWSPSGESLVYQSYDPERAVWDIFRYDLETDQTYPLAPSDGSDEAPEWSPDGQWVAFSSSRNGNWDIYRMRPDGSDIRNLTRSPDWEMTPMWSADSQWITFEVIRDRFARVRTDGSERNRINIDQLDVVSRNTAPIIDIAWRPALMGFLGLALFMLSTLPRILPTYTPSG